MIRLYLVRHGETEYNLQGRIQGQGDSPLTRLGVRQAEAAAKRLAHESFDAIYSSDLGRARQTADIIAASHSTEVHPSSLLRERNFGVLQGMTRDEIEERYPASMHEWRRDTLHLAPPEAETHAGIVERCGEFLESVRRSYEGDAQLLIVGHGGSVRGLVLAALGLPLDAFRMLHFSNASLSILDLNQVSSIRLLNDTCHLALVEVTDVDADSAG